MRSNFILALVYGTLVQATNRLVSYCIQRDEGKVLAGGSQCAASARHVAVRAALIVLKVQILLSNLKNTILAYYSAKF
jgi:hypothetical protein